MEGNITAFSGTALTVNVLYTGGSGTIASWTITDAGISGTSGYSGYSGYSGTNGTNGATGTSGYSGYSGTNGTNGATGTSGYSGYSGATGSTGTSGYSGYSGATGSAGTSGFSGYSGAGGSFSVSATTSNTTYYVVGATGTGSVTPYISNTNAVYYNASNGYLYGVATQATSDERLKTNWRPLVPNFIERLAEVKYGIYDRVDMQDTQAGVSAQSLEAVLKEVISINKDGYLTVNYGNAALVAVIELAKEVINLRQKIEELGK